jgi:hypothetical protein
LAAQIAANYKVAGFAVWLFEVVIQNVSRAAPADSELKLVNGQILWHLLDHAQIKLEMLSCCLLLFDLGGVVSLAILHYLPSP